MVVFLWAEQLFPKHPMRKKLSQSPYRLSILICYLCLYLTMQAAPVCKVIRYDENCGLSHWRVTQILQDHKGMLWFATWNGLNRYDGYEFKCFKVEPGDGCSMTNNRIRNIWLITEGDICCKNDDGYYLFDLRSYCYRDIPAEEQQQMDDKLLRNNRGFSIQNQKDSKLTYEDRFGTFWTLDTEGNLYWKKGTRQDLGNKPYPLEIPIETPRFAYPDTQGNLWLLSSEGIYKLCFHDNPIETLEQENETHVRSIFTDKKDRYWVTGRDDATVRLYDSGNKLLGYLGSDGRLHQRYVSFNHPIYCITQSLNGDYWLGAKPGGIIRLREKGNGTFDISHWGGENDSPSNAASALSHSHVYDIKEDSYGRLWIATLGGGINCLETPEQPDAHFIHAGNGLKGYPINESPKVRFIHITNDSILMAATTVGLLTADIRERDLGRIKFHRHTAQHGISDGLSCSATMDIAENSKGELFISTESGGVNKLITQDLLADTLRFKHYNTKNGLPSDVILSMAVTGNRLWVVCGNQLCLLDPDTGQGEHYDGNFLMRECRFSEAHPIQLPDGRWLFGLHDGAFALKADRLRKSSYSPPIVITGADIQNKGIETISPLIDTLTLSSKERNLTIHYAALDYTDARHLQYAFRLDYEGNKSEWNHVQSTRSATFLDLKPGSYTLSIRSTNSDGLWSENTRSITIIVTPTFWETGWATLLYILIFIMVTGSITYTIIYIRRINRKQRETLEAYLALLNRPEEHEAHPVPSQSAPKISEEDDLFMRRVMDFVEANISNPDINISDMAEAAATSRSGLNRKMKSILGITPLDFLREARLKKAFQLLDEKELTIAEVAFQCGFADPKYFSRCFKASTGLSPSEYKGQHQ